MIEQIKKEFDKYARYDCKCMATFRYMTNELSPYAIAIMDEDGVYNILLKNGYVNESNSPNTHRNYLKKIRFVQRFFRLNQEKHGEWYMQKMNLLEVIEHWMLNPEQKFMNAGGRIYHMNKYGLIENNKGDVLSRNPDMLRREWVLV